MKNVQSQANAKKPERQRLACSPVRAVFHTPDPENRTYPQKDLRCALKVFTSKGRPAGKSWQLVAMLVYVLATRRILRELALDLTTGAGRIRQKAGTWPSSNPKPKKEGKPCIILHPCSNFSQSTAQCLAELRRDRCGIHLCRSERGKVSKAAAGFRSPCLAALW